MKQSTLHDINLFARRGDDQVASPTFHTVTPACAWELAYASAGYSIGWTLPLDLPHFVMPDEWWAAMLLEDTASGLSIHQAIFRTEPEAIKHVAQMNSQAQHLRETGVVVGGYRATLRFPNNFIANLAKDFEDHLDRKYPEGHDRESDSTLAMGAFSSSALGEIMGINDTGELNCTSNFGVGMGIVYSPVDWREVQKLRRAEAARVEHIAAHERSRGSVGQ
jgi:hypothetical protein